MSGQTDRTERRTKLTKRAVDAANPAAARFIVWDSALPGFGLRVEPSGLKVFVARYRVGGGRTGTLRQATIGRHGTLTADEARTNARKLLAKAAGGGDPVGDARAKRQAGITVGEVCDWYMREARAQRLLGRHGRPIRPGTLESDRGRIDIHVKPTIGGRAVKSLTIADLERLQANIAASLTTPIQPEKRKRGGLARGGGGVAARTLQMLGAIFANAVRHQLIEANPARGARKIAGKRRTDRLTLDEIRRLGEVIRTGDENPTAVAAIRLITLTGLRRNEALSLRPSSIIAAGGLDLPATKTGPARRPIGAAALESITAQMERSGSRNWIFPADRGDGHFVGLPKSLTRLCKAAKLRPVTAHTLRHTFASIAAEIGFSELTIAGLLGHAAGSVTAGYIHLDTALVTAADRVSATIADALDGKEGSKVIPLRSEARNS